MATFKLVTSKVPPALPTVSTLASASSLVLKSTLLVAVSFNAPPSKVIPVEAKPKLLSFSTINTPPLTCVPPAYALSADSVNVPSPLLTKAPFPCTLLKTLTSVAFPKESKAVSIPPVVFTIISLLKSKLALVRKLPPFKNNLP